MRGASSLERLRKEVVTADADRYLIVQYVPYLFNDKTSLPSCFSQSK